MFFRSNVSTDEFSYKGAYIKYVGGGGEAEGFTDFSKTFS